jgi:uncharacterized membrane protein
VRPVIQEEAGLDTADAVADPGIAQYVPQIFWRDIPLDQLEACIRGHVPAEMADTVERGMQTARFKLTE